MFGRSIGESVMTTQKQVSSFLDALRQSGACNMFGSGKYVSENFSDLDKKEVETMVLHWMKHFGEDDQ
jgi:hypothetical protein